MNRQELARIINQRLSRNMVDFDSVFTTMTNPEASKSQLPATQTLDVSKKLVKRTSSKQFRTITPRKTYHKQRQPWDPEAVFEKDANSERVKKQNSLSLHSKNRALSLDYAISPQKLVQNRKKKSVGSFETDKNKLDITLLDYRQVMGHMLSYWHSFSIDSSPQEIYAYFRPIWKGLSKPSIKKYTNCVYYGESYRHKACKYQGFIYFCSKRKLYYGNFVDQRQHGKGIEIHLPNSIVFMGQFCEGEKTGKFQVIKEHQRYHGQLTKGKYEGYGVLQTVKTIYEGYFLEGHKHGPGKQYEKDSGQLIQGEFYYDQFIPQKTLSSQLEIGTTQHSLVLKNNWQAQKQQNLPKFTYPTGFKAGKRQEHQSTLLESAIEDEPLPLIRRSPTRKYMYKNDKQVS